MNSSTNPKCLQPPPLHMAKGVILPEPEAPTAIQEPPPETNHGEKARSLSRILRIMGAFVLLGSAGAFMFRQWDQGNDLVRYASLLGYTLLISAAGFYCGVGIRESKGARTLLSLVLAVTPVHFAILGGFFYSQFAWDNAVTQIPKFALWQASSPGAAWAIFLVAGAALLPLIYLSFLTFARRQALLLTLSFAGFNSLLLLPLRSTDLVAMVMTAGTMGWLLLNLKFLANAAALKTWEGHLVRLILGLPILIIAGRAAIFYELSMPFTALGFACIALLSFSTAPHYHFSKATNTWLQGLAILPAGLSWAVVCHDWLLQLPTIRSWAAPLLLLPFAAMLFTFSFFSLGNGEHYRRLGVISALLGVTSHLFTLPGPGSTLLCFTVALCALIYGFLQERKIIFLAGLCTAALAMVYHVRFTVQFDALFHWGSLAVMGVVIILAGSYLERNYARLIQKCHQFRSKYQSWHY